MKVVGEEEHHFFGSSIMDWQCTTEDRDLRGLINFFEVRGYPYSIYMVPGPHDRNYKIEHYKPVVDDLVWLGVFDPAFPSD
jgi:hypothetical protein